MNSVLESSRAGTSDLPRSPSSTMMRPSGLETKFIGSLSAYSRGGAHVEGPLGCRVGVGRHQKFGIAALLVI